MTFLLHNNKTTVVGHDHLDDGHARNNLAGVTVLLLCVLKADLEEDCEEG